MRRHSSAEAAIQFATMLPDWEVADYLQDWRDGKPLEPWLDGLAADLEDTANIIAGMRERAGNELRAA